MTWIQHPLTLHGNRIDLVSLEPAFFPALKVAALDPRIWEFYTVNGADPDVYARTLEDALAERERGTQFPFVVVEKSSGAVIGSTRYMEMNPAHKKLEIGWTWLVPHTWTTSVNPECKMLLLTHAFETMGCFRVQLRTDAINVRSQKAIGKIGATYEGKLRNDYIRHNGTHRDSMMYSITHLEWPSAKQNLLALINERHDLTGQ